MSDDKEVDVVKAYMDPSQFYKDKERCLDALCEARKVFGSTKTTYKQYQAMQNVLVMILLYCPKDVQCAAQSTLDESVRREIYFAVNVWKDTDDEET